MTALLSGVGLKVRSLFKSQKPLDTWVKTATTDDVQKALTEIFINGNEEQNFGPALTPTELSTFKKSFQSLSPADTGISECLSFYAGYPFQPLPLPLSSDSLLRAVVALTGRDEKALDRRDVVRRGGEDKVLKRGRTQDDKLRLLFCALSGGEPTQEDILDVLSLVQPRPDMIYGPWGHEQLRPMAARLAPQSPTATSATKELGIPKEKLVAFMKAVDFEGPTVEGDVISLEMFKNIANEKPGFLDAVSRKAGIFLSNP